MVLTTPVEMHTTPSTKNAYALVHAHICNGAEASLPWKLLRTYLESCTSIVQATVCRPLLPPLLLSRPNPSPDAVRSKNSSKSTLAHDAVATAVSHKHHSIIRVGAGLVQFVYGLHSRLATELTHHRNLFPPFFARVIQTMFVKRYCTTSRTSFTSSAPTPRSFIIFIKLARESHTLPPGKTPLGLRMISACVRLLMSYHQTPCRLTSPCLSQLGTL